MRVLASLVALLTSLACVTPTTKGERALSALDRVAVGGAAANLGANAAAVGGVALVYTATIGLNSHKPESYAIPAGITAVGLGLFGVGLWSWHSGRVDFVQAIDDDSAVIDRVKAAEDRRERRRPSRDTPVVCTPGWDCPVEDE